MQTWKSSSQQVLYKVDISNVVHEHDTTVTMVHSYVDIQLEVTQSNDNAIITQIWFVHEQSLPLR